MSLIFPNIDRARIAKRGNTGTYKDREPLCPQETKSGISVSILLLLFVLEMPFFCTAASLLSSW